MKNKSLNLSAFFLSSKCLLLICFAFNFCTFLGGAGTCLIGSPSASSPVPKPAVSFLIRPLIGSLIPSRPGAPRPRRLSGSQPYVERYRNPTCVRSRCDGGWEWARQTWWASEASCGFSWEVFVFSADVSEESGRLHISQWSLVCVEGG